MANLVNANAANATQVVKGYAYNRSLVKAGILHFGVGNFHRAHLEFMTNMLLENNTQHNWGICGAMILPGDERLYHALKKQDGEYTLPYVDATTAFRFISWVRSLNSIGVLRSRSRFWTRLRLRILRSSPSLSPRADTTSLVRVANSCSTMRRWLTISRIQPSRLLPLDMLPRDCVAARQQAMVLSPSFPAIICSTMAIQPARLS